MRLTQLFNHFAVSSLLIFSTMVHAEDPSGTEKLVAYIKQLKIKKDVEKVRKKRLAPVFNLNDLNNPYASWGISPQNSKSSINLMDAWRKFKKPANGNDKVVVAVIDTGIDPDHPFIKNNIVVKDGKYGQTNYGMDFSRTSSKKINRNFYSKKPLDQHGHGTHVSGIIKSVFPNVSLLSLKYYNPKATGRDNLNSTIKALKYAVNQNVDIINYSGGGPEPAEEELRILRLAEKKGILVIAAAGNEEDNIDVNKNAYYPASYGLSNIITVTAHDQGVRILPSSNYGKLKVHLSAPGYRIKSSTIHQRAAYLTGTSQATAFVTGVAALIKSQYPNLSYRQIKESINKSARKHPNLTAKCATGGLLDASNARDYAEKLAASNSSKRILANHSKKKKGKIIYRVPQ
jgi:subtilisin family serine protease